MKRLVWTLLLVSVSGSLTGAQSVEDYLRQARALSNQHQIEQAQRLLKEAIARYPANVELLLSLGETFRRGSDLQQAERIFYQALSLSPGNTTALSRLGEIQMWKGEFEAALPFFEASVESDSQDSNSYHNLAFSQLALGNTGAALEAAKRSVATNPQSEKYRILLAQLLNLSGQSQQAYQELKEAHEMAPENAHLAFRLSEMDALEGRLEPALGYARKAVELDTENPLFRNHFATILENLGREELANQEATAAQRLERAFDAFVEALDLKGQEKISTAIEVLEPAIEKNPEFTTGRLFLASLYKQSGKDDRALQLYSEILDEDPAHAVALDERAWLEISKGQFDRAEATLKSQARPGSSQTLVQAYRSLDTQDWEAALERFQILLRDEPLNTELLKLIAFCHAQLGRENEALRLLDRAGQMRPDDPELTSQRADTLFQRAVRLIQEEKWTEAESLLSRLVEDDNKVGDYFLNRAYARQRLGQFQEARADYQRGLELAPGEHWARVRLGNLLNTQGQYHAAANQLEIVQKNAPIGEAYFELGISYNHLNRLRDSELAFEKARTMEGSTPRVLYNLGLTQFRQGKTQSGLHHIRMAASRRHPAAMQFLKAYRARGGRVPTGE